MNGKEVALTLKEFELLEKLMLNKGIVLTRDQLLTEIWGYDLTVRQEPWMSMCVAPAEAGGKG